MSPEQLNKLSQNMGYDARDLKPGAHLNQYNAQLNAQLNAENSVPDINRDARISMLSSKLNYAEIRAAHHKERADKAENWAWQLLISNVVVVIVFFIYLLTTLI